MRQKLAGQIEKEILKLWDKFDRNHMQMGSHEEAKFIAQAIAESIKLPEKKHIEIPNPNRPSWVREQNKGHNSCIDKAEEAWK